MEETLLSKVQNATSEWLADQGHIVSSDQVLVNTTRKEFEGSLTVVTFPFVKILRSKPEEVGNALGAYLVESMPAVAGYNVVKGFLNLEVTKQAWMSLLQSILQDQTYGESPATGRKFLVEFCSPNTNKPLHLGHIRNIMLGWSCAQILQANGHEVVKMQIINDRGIAICKSMLAWLRFGEGITPEQAGIKGDALVGQFYVRFDQELAKEYSIWQKTPLAQDLFEQSKSDDQEKFFAQMKNTYFNSYSTLGRDAREMLLKWEDGDAETLALWNKMNGWVYSGFDATFADLKISFDKLYYESDTYKLGKKYIEQGLESEVFYKKEDGSVWVDLTDQKMDEKILLRSDGTSVYLTQDIGTAIQRFEDYGADSMIYVVGDEQNYHFKVLFEVMRKLKMPFADALHHLSYGMIDLPTGRMKSREGTVVDADDLIIEVQEEAEKLAMEKGELSALQDEERKDIFEKIGLGALKFFILKVNPQKRMIFNPAASVDLQGQTGPYIQNAYVRIQSLFRKATDRGEETLGTLALSLEDYELHSSEKSLLQQLLFYPNVIESAGADLDPSGIANYCYDLAKNYHRLYHDLKILTAETETARSFRLLLSKACGQVLQHAMNLLGISMPDRM